MGLPDLGLTDADLKLVCAYGSSLNPSKVYGKQVHKRLKEYMKRHGNTELFPYMLLSALIRGYDAAWCYGLRNHDGSPV